jgi:phage-related protein
MADVSVEFGAKDTGLEQTLKTVQSQLTSLEEEVKSGTLSFDELQQTMRKIGQAEKVEAQLQAMATGVDTAGNAASAATPKVDAIGNEMQKTGNEAKDVGDKSEGGFLKMASAVAVGQAAVNIATAAIGAAFNAVKGSIDEFGAALDLGARLSDLSERTGETAGNMLLLERAFQNSGAGAEMAGSTINKLQKFIEDAGNGAKPQTDAMARLGVTLEELAGKTPTEQLQVFAQKISSIEDPGKRAALAMSVFGEEGMKLLPLLSNFSGEIGTAQGQLGGMVDVMNRNAETFDAVSDKVDVIAGKFMEFAAGVLDKVAPALDAVTEALSRIDAAAIGQKFADAFTGGVEAMKGFQSAVDAFKTGNIEGALAVLWQSIKVQAMMTGDEIFKRLQAGFSAAWEFVKDIFAPDGMIVNYIGGAFELVAYKITEALGKAFLSFIDNLPGWFTKINPIIGMLGDTIRTTVNKASEDARDIWGAMSQDVDYVGAQITGAASRISENFNAALGETNSLFTGTNAEAEKLAQMQAEIAAKAKELPPAIDAATASTAALLEQEKKKLEAEVASSKAKADAAEKTFEQIENEIELNAAIASGNEKEIERVKEKQRQAELSQKIKDIEAELPAIIQDIIDKTGTSEETAKGLAEQLVAGRIAAAGVAANAAEIKTPLEGANEAAKTVKQTMADIENAKLEAAPERLKERTADAREELKSMADFIGQDLSKMPLDDILTKLGLDPSDFATTDEKLTALEGSLEKLGSADPAEITPEVDLVGVNDRLDKVKEYLSGTEKEKPDVTPQVDQAAVETAVKKAKETIDSELKSPVDVNLNAEKAIGKIREDLKEQIDLAIGSSEGTKHLSSIDQLVSKIEQLVSKIEGKLPMQALAY